VSLEPPVLNSGIVSGLETSNCHTKAIEIKTGWELLQLLLWWHHERCIDACLFLQRILLCKCTRQPGSKQAKQVQSCLPTKHAQVAARLPAATKVINEDPRQSPYHFTPHWRTQQNLSLNNEHHQQAILVNHCFTFSFSSTSDEQVKNWP